jgi:hypothetical protein
MIVLFLVLCCTLFCIAPDVRAQSLTASGVQDSTVTLTPLVPVIFTGQVGVSYGYNSIATQGALFLHFGGPGLTWKYGDWSLCLHVSPSVRWQIGDQSGAAVRPTMGFGPTLCYKRWLLVAPIYFEAAGGRTAYIPTIGIGYRF